MPRAPILPELIAQLVDPADANLSAGSNVSILWRCPKDPRHVWSASPNTRKKSRGCSVCLNRVVVAGVNDLWTNEPTLAAELADPDVGGIVHSGSHKKVHWTCRINPSHQWEASVVSRTRLGSNCPYCSGRVPLPGHDDLATTHPVLSAQLLDPSEATTVGAGSAKKLLWQCPTEPAHTWKAEVRNRTAASREVATGCPHCAGRTKRLSQQLPTLGELESDLLDEAVDPSLAASLSKGSGRSLQWNCSQCPVPHPPYTMSVRHRVRGQRCPVAAGNQVFVGVNDLATTHPMIAAQLLEPSQGQKLTRGSTTIAQWCCDQDHRWSTPVYARVAGNGCPTCCPIGSSYGEQEVLAILRVVEPTASHRTRLPQVNGRAVEVDVVAGDLAVEFNGLYWHSEAIGSPSRHRDKVLAIRAAGLDPLTVWEDEWADPVRRAVLVTTMAHRLGALGLLQDALVVADVADAFEPAMIEQIGARSLQPSIMTGTDTSEFLTRHHVQGDVRLSRAFALLDADDRPRAVLGLRSPRHGSRTRRGAGVWEIQRYATLGIVPGGFSRLLAYAEKALRDQGEELIQWVSMSSDESSRGKLYERAGFTRDGDVPPNYWYTGGHLRTTRAPKEAFQLKRFRNDDSLTYQEGWTERDAAAANKLLRVYDAGKTRWVKNVA